VISLTPTSRTHTLRDRFTPLPACTVWTTLLAFACSTHGSDGALPARLERRTHGPRPRGTAPGSATLKRFRVERRGSVTSTAC
jgi:hypothetical protein